MKNLYFISAEPLHSRLEDLFQFEKLSLNKINLTYLDISEILFPKKMIFKKIILKNIKYLNISNINDFHNFIKSEIKISSNIFWYCPMNLKALICYFILCRYSQNIVASSFTLPTSLDFKFFNFFYLKKLFNRFLKKLLFYTKILKKFQITFYAGKKSLINTFPSLQYTQIYHFDYAYFLNHNSNNEFNIKDKHILFIDTGLTRHPDLLSKNILLQKENKYLKHLNKFFSFLEKNYNSKVIISGHPKVAYDKSDFVNRKIVYGKTLELVKNSKFVVLHNSTAISYVAIFKKKFLLLTSKDIDSFMINKSPGQILYGMSYYFKKKLINIDEDFDIRFINNLLNTNDYTSSYVEDYLYTKDSKFNLSDSILNWINNE